MNFDAFRTITDISVALAGFIGIVIVLQHRDKAFFQVGMITIFGTSFGATVVRWNRSLYVRKASVRPSGNA